jgi:hypothetical protein
MRQLLILLYKVPRILISNDRRGCILQMKSLLDLLAEIKYHCLQCNVTLVPTAMGARFIVLKVTFEEPQTELPNLGYEVITSVTMNSTVFWVESCVVKEKSRRFGGTYRHNI